MSDLVFEKFPSIKRLKRKCIITEKIDGTNAQVAFDKDGNILCGSRNRIITPDDDNYGFARWAYERQVELFQLLGVGRHYGEWWGSGIQRKYGLTDGDKRFSLFNTARWTQDDPDKLKAVDGLGVVPVLYEGDFSTDVVDDTMSRLLATGSQAAEGFNNPEGIVVFHSQLRELFKVTFEHDATGKPE